MINLDYLEPDITFFTRSAVTDVRQILKRLHDHFDGNSQYFELRHGGYDAGEGTGSGGFVVGPKDTSQIWEFTMQRSGTSTIRSQLDPSGSYTNGPTSTTGFPTGGSNMVSTTLNIGSSAYFNISTKTIFTLVEFPDAFLFFGNYFSNSYPSWAYHAGSIYIPSTQPEDFDNQSTLGWFCWASTPSIMDALSTGTGDHQIKLRASKTGNFNGDWEGDPFSQDLNCILNEIETGHDSEKLGDKIVPAPVIMRHSTNGRFLGVLKYIYQMLPASTYGTQVQDLEGNVKYLFWGGSITGGSTTKFIIPWNSTAEKPIF